jgi:hypothetical protein
MTYQEYGYTRHYGLRQEHYARLGQQIAHIPVENKSPLEDPAHEL